MTITAAAVVPHPPILLPAIGKGEEKKIADIEAAYQTAAKTIQDTHPETLVIVTPHGPSYADYIHISKGKKAHGDMRQFGDKADQVDVAYDEELIQEITRLAAEQGLPAGTLGQQDGRLDHGTVIPALYFQPEQMVRISVGGPSNRIHYELGKLIQQAAENIGRKVAVVSSSDLSHCQKAGTHYGYKPCGPAYDAKFMDIVKNADFQQLLDIPEKEADQAMVCGQKPMCVLAGALDGLRPEARALAHSAVFGVGYGVGTFTSLTEDPRRTFAPVLSKAQSEMAQAAKSVIEAYVK